MEKKNKISILIIFVSLLLNKTVFTFDSYPYSKVIKLIILIIMGILLINIIFELYSKKKINKENLWVMLLISLFFYKLNNLVFQFFFNIILFNIFYVDRKKLYITLYKVIACMCLVSLSSYILILFNIMDLGGTSFISDNISKKGILYYQNFLNVNITFNGFFIKRFQSIFDEPGMLGTIVGLLLLFDKNSKELKKERIILIISGILTLSTAFYIYLTIKIIQMIKKVKSIFFIIFLFITLIMSKSLIMKEFPYFYYRSFGSIERLVFEKKDNRISNEADLILSEFKKTDRAFFGTNRLFNKDYPEVDISSWMNIVYTQGYIGLFVYIFTILYLSKFTKKDFYTKVAILSFIISIYQRPYMLDYLGVIILIAGSEYSDSKKRKGDFVYDERI